MKNSVLDACLVTPPISFPKNKKSSDTASHEYYVNQHSSKPIGSIQIKGATG